MGLARIAGVHLEGPFLGAAPGAHPPELLGPVDLEWLLALLDRSRAWCGWSRSRPKPIPGFAGTRALAERGVVVSLGHSRCTYEDARAAADAGATMVTHLFNGMGPLAHRAPGLPGAALDDDRLTPGLIADSRPRASRAAAAGGQREGLRARDRRGRGRRAVRRSGCHRRVTAPRTSMTGR